MQNFWKVFVASCCAVILMACQPEPKMEKGKVDPEAEALETHANSQESIMVSLINREDVEIGEARLEQTEEGVQITVEGHHLPSGLHGFHIHEKGICEAPSFESAGGHFNPGSNKHGFDHAEGPHAGDIENLEVAEDGTVGATFLNKSVRLDKDMENTLFSEEGTALVIHENPDDYDSQPAGDAGDRIACGVIVSPKDVSQN